MARRSEFPASVIVLSYNQASTICLALKSLDHQFERCTFEVIIADDGSNSEEIERIQQVVRKCRVPITIIRMRHTNCRAALRNRAIELSRGSIIVLLDGDMVPDRDFVRKHLEAHTSGTSKLVAGNRFWRDIDWINKYFGDPKKWLEALKSSQLSEELATRQSNEMRRRANFLCSSDPWRACFSCNLSFPNEPLARFDEMFVGWGPEDREFAFRLQV